MLKLIDIVEFDILDNVTKGKPYNINYVLRIKTKIGYNIFVNITDGDNMTNKYTTKKPKCPNCGREMYCIDIDENFDGCQNNYWECECGYSAFNKVRYGNQLKFTYYNEEGEKLV